jgi:hypothetical protein
MKDFADIDYLKRGSPTQRQAFEVLSDSKILTLLGNFDATLVGTFPIGIDIEGSDLDIACRFSDRTDFESTITSYFGKSDRFSIRRKRLDSGFAVIATFFFKGFEFEIFGQDIPVSQQHGYRHMILEHKILEREGEAFRREIIELRKSGVKTEPAFAKLLGIEGDPYIGLLEFES